MRYLEAALKIALAIVVLVLMFGAGWITGRLGIGQVVAPESLNELERAFVEQMRGATLVGHFTLGNGEPRARPDRYEIDSVEKVGDATWRFNARVGGLGTAIPIVVPMQWIGDTPMIMMTDMSIPSLGTFTTRVFFYGDRYAGTWQHGTVWGHMFGTIERAGEPGRAGRPGRGKQ